MGFLGRRFSRFKWLITATDMPHFTLNEKSLSADLDRGRKIQKILSQRYESTTEIEYLFLFLKKSV